MSFELRPVTTEEIDTFAATFGVGFGFQPDPDDMDFWRDFLERDRTLAAFDGGLMVGTAGAISFQMTLPGEVTAPAAGVTIVSVLPTHRRRGLLKSMMRYQLEDFRKRSEPLAILLASESLLYGRYGYGLATTQAEYEIDRAHGALRSDVAVPGTVSIVDKERARQLLPQVYERVRPSRPGFVNRTDVWWDMWMKDPERERRGASARFYVIYEQAGEPQGYVAYRVKIDWSEGIARGEVHVHDLMTATPEAYIAIWQYLMSLDLTQRVQLRLRPSDEAVRWMLADPRRLLVTEIGDHIWVRLVDVASGLEARRYTMEGAVCVAIEDPFCPENAGTYRLEGGPDGAICRRTDSEPDIALHVDDLGAAYLGGVSFRTLARAGRVEERVPGSIRRADAMFVSDVAPWCANYF